MIRNILKVKNHGLVFRDYARSGDTPEFKRYNLIYGWNGSGKTTLSRLFEIVAGSTEWPEVECTVEDNTGARFGQDQVFPKRIRVFSSDYIRRNIQILEGRANAITVLLGQQNQALVQQIAADERTLNGADGQPGKLQALDEARRELARKDKERDKVFTNIAKVIGAALIGSAYRNYRAPDAKRDAAGLSAKELLTEEEIDACTLALKQSPMAEVAVIKAPTVAATDLTLDGVAASLLSRGRTVLQRTSQSETIERLASNPDIARWVEVGLRLHEQYSSSACEFCQQPVPQTRLDDLRRHFNDEDARIKNEVDEVDTALGEVARAIEGVSTVDPARLYEELRADYIVAQDRLAEAKVLCVRGIEEVRAQVRAKKTTTNIASELACTIDCKGVSEAIESLNQQIAAHNAKAADFTKAHTETAAKLKRHFLSTVADEVAALDVALADLGESVKKLEQGDPADPTSLGIVALRERIAANRAKVSSTHKAAEDINKALVRLLGHNELCFEVSEGGAAGESDVAPGYAIRRGGTPATSLSEGEKTAIAFAYFTVHLGDQEFNLKDGIVVLDDPISSLDANLLFRVATYIQVRLQNAHQLFVLTHNYDFFNQLKKWFCNVVNEEDRSLLMLTNESDGSGRKAQIVVLDPLLRDHESEYHYLFHKLTSFEQDAAKNPTPASIQSIYDYPNLARKFLECFLSFRVPSRSSFQVRLQGLKDINKDISGEDIEYVYKFVNSHSHLDSKSGLIQFDPTLSLSAADSIKMMLKMVQQADPKHFKAMEKTCSKAHAPAEA